MPPDGSAGPAKSNCGNTLTDRRTLTGDEWSGFSGAVSTTGQGEALYRGLVAVRIAEKLGHQQQEKNGDGNDSTQRCVLTIFVCRISSNSFRGNYFFFWKV